MKKAPVKQESIESRAILFGCVSGIIGLIVALWIFWGQVVPLFGSESIGSVASILAALCAFVAFVASWRSPAAPNDRSSRRGHRYLTAAALGFTHAAIALLLTIVLFFLIQSAFVGVKLGDWTAAILTSLVAGLAGYAASLAGARLTSLRLASTLAAFLVSGTLVSMITSPDPYWWQLHFSSLGGGDSVSATAFNLTLIIGGIVLIGLADLIAAEFSRWQKTKTELAAVKVSVIRIAIAAIGLCLACVGLFVYNKFVTIHNLAATLMGLIFIALVVSLRWVAPGFQRTFYLVSYVMVAAVLVSAWLFADVGYFNLTAVELALAGITFAWIVVFVRYLAAGLADATGG